MKRFWICFMSCFCFAALAASSGLEKPLHDQGTQPVPVHRIPLLNELGEQIVPGYEMSLPVSFRKTCGDCHEYEMIREGWHFNAGKSCPHIGRAGEPWVWVDEGTGTQIPLSYRDWEGLWHPEELGLSDWDFTLLFGRHLPGGGLSEPSGIPSNPDARWRLSGKLEINCLACHHQSMKQDMSEWTRQILRENLRWAGTAASCLGSVGGMASRVGDTWDIFQGPDLDDKEYAVPPYVEYDSVLFDTKNWMVVDISDVPEDRRCLYCHSVKAWEADEETLSRNDVHRAAGLRCVDCHSNELGHHIARGFEGETEMEGSPVEVDSSCRACHIREACPSDPFTMGGWLGAPIALHKGLPELHLDKLSCTACHSGPWPRENPQQIQVSRANRLGIHGAARWDREAPAIVEPVYVRNDQGKIESRRMLWPSFWAQLEDGQLEPLAPSLVSEAGEGILNVEARVAVVLKALARTDKIEGTPVLLAGDDLYGLNVDDLLDPVQGENEPPADSAPFCVLVEQSLTPLLRDLKAEFTGLSRAELTLAPQQQEALLERKESLLEEQLALLEETLQTVNYDPEDEYTRVVSYGRKTYLLGEDGKAEQMEKPGPVAPFVQWGWLSKTGHQTISPGQIDRSDKETLGTRQGIDETKALEVLTAIQKVYDKEGFPVLVSEREAYRKTAEGGLAKVRLFIEIPEANIPWMWMTDRQALPLIQAFEPGSEQEEQPAKRILSVLQGIQESQLFEGEPFCLYKDRVYRQTKARFEEISAEEAKTIYKAHADAVSAVEQFKEENGLISFTNKKFFKRADPDSPVRRTDPLMKELSPLVDRMEELQATVDKMASFGDHHFREDTSAMTAGGIPSQESGLDLSGLETSDLSPDKVPVLALLRDDGSVAPLCRQLWVDVVEKTLGDETLLTEKQVNHTLKALAKEGENTFVYVCEGKLFRASPNGELAAEDHPKAAPYSWAFAHDVRPAGQSLGMNGCTDCHSSESPFFFGQVRAMGPLLTQEASIVNMFELEGIDAALQQLTGTAYLLRDWVSYALIGLCVLVGAVLALFGLKALDRVTSFLGDEGE